MKKAIIIGAGPAGLTAAYELLTQTDIKPIIFETDSQVGGISKTINYKNNRIDLGGHRFFSKSDEIIRWWLQFVSLEKEQASREINIRYQNKIKTFKPGEHNTNLSAIPAMMIRKRRSRIYHDKKFFDYPLQLNLQTVRKLGLRKMTRIGMSYIKAKLFPNKEEITLSQFFENRFGKELFLTFFKDYTEKVWGVKCEDLPASWGHQRIKDLNISKAIVQATKSLFKTNTSITQKGTSTSLIEQFLYPQYGPGQMWETVAKEVIRLGGEIHLSTKVTRLVSDKDNIITHVDIKNTTSGEIRTLSGDLFFSTMPIKDLIARMEHPTANVTIQELAKGLEYREFIIAGLLLTKGLTESLQTQQLFKDNWIYLQDGKIKAARLQIFNNWSPFMVNDPETIWIGVEYFCKEHDEFWEQSDDEIAAIAIEEMEKIEFLSKKDVLDYTVVKVQKAYPSYTGTYDRFDEIKDYIDKFPNLYLIGRNGMHRYNNTDHSMMTAILAVQNIINSNKSRKNIWDVNMEKDYHEEA